MTHLFSSPFLKNRIAIGIGFSFVFTLTSLVSAQTLPLDASSSFVHFKGEAFLHNFNGEVKKITGTAELNPSAVPPLQKATLHFKTASLTTENKERDQNMWNWLKVDVHPEAIFQLDEVQLKEGNDKTANAAHPATFTILGHFILNRQREPLSGIAQGWREKNKVIVSGETTIDTLKYGLPKIQKLFMTVGKDVQITYHLAFILPDAYSQK